ncbi:hypothetical protein [Embleya scabrispora]|uniref:arsenate reductase/protein-tyrosine-phosphatase family protein n=1 Tax=Embleya scabrispora TaxID=159449 RepID=UPI000378B38B|nr:hypothetical protein [Embleya scabrispora]MYS85695.1 hypothetical protein [Streptomyces sp. SID5474]
MRTTSLLFVCTGNATRAVIAGEPARIARPDRPVATAGTFVVEGLPISWRTRSALAELGLQAPHHRSTQPTDGHVAAADLVIAQGYQHIRYIRRHHPHGAARTATLKRLVRDLPAAGPTDEPLAHRLDRADFVPCAHEPAAPMRDPLPRLGTRIPSP